MWVYIQSEPNLWTVGFYAPDGKWHPDSDHSESEKAAQRCHWLNGGSVEDDGEGEYVLTDLGRELAAKLKEQE